MKIYSVKPVRYVIVDTSIGNFKVYADDSLTMLDEDSQSFTWFDLNDISEDEQKKIIELGKKSMPMS